MLFFSLLLSPCVHTQTLASSFELDNGFRHYRFKFFIVLDRQKVRTSMLKKLLGALGHCYGTMSNRIRHADSKKKSQVLAATNVRLVPETGIEPVRPLLTKRRILSPLCLPISPLGQHLITLYVKLRGVITQIIHLNNLALVPCAFENHLLH